MNKPNLLSVIIPAFNEEVTLPVLLSQLTAPDVSIYIEKIIIVDDGSTDRTLLLAQDIASKHKHIDVYSLPKNSGKAEAVRLGMKYAGNYVLVQDADLEYNPIDIPAIAEPLLAGKADVVFGSRLIRRNRQTHKLNRYTIANYLITFFTNKIARQKTTDVMTGYKAFRKDVFVALKCTGENFDQCAEITIKSLNSRFRCLDVQISYFPRDKKSGKKIVLKDFFTIIKTIWSHRNFTC